MIITEMILRLRAECPFFEQRVGGMADFDKATVEDNDLATPYAFVVAVEEEAEPATGNAIAQQVSATFIVVTVFNTQSEKDDGTAMSARTGLEIARRQLLDALLGWEPVAWSAGGPKVPEGYEDLVPNSRLDTMRYRGMSLVKVTDGRVWYQFEFGTSFYEGRNAVKEWDRYTTAGIALVNGEATVINASLPTAGTAKITRVLTNADVYVPRSHYSLVGGKIVLTAKGKAIHGLTPTLKVLYEVQTPRYYEIVRQVYAQYYPELLELAASNNGVVTPSMYDLISEVPEDAKIGWLKIHELEPISEPSHVFGGTPYIEPEETP